MKPDRKELNQEKLEQILLHIHPFSFLYVLRKTYILFAL